MAVRVPGERHDAPGTREGGLRADLGGHVAGADAAAQEAFGELGEPQEPPVIVDEAPDRPRIAHRPATHEIDVEADLEVRLHPRLGSRLGRRVGGHHEGRRANDASAVRLEDPFRDSRRQTEVVGGDDEGHLPYTPRMALSRITNRSRSIFGVSARKSIRVSPCCRSAKGISRTA